MYCDNCTHCGLENTFLYVYMYACIITVYVWTYVCTYRERERERDDLSSVVFRIKLLLYWLLLTIITDYCYTGNATDNFDNPGAAGWGYRHGILAIHILYLHAHKAPPPPPVQNTLLSPSLANAPRRCSSLCARSLTHSHTHWQAHSVAGFGEAAPCPANSFCPATGNF